MVGSAIVRQLEQDPSVDIITRSRDELDLTDQAQVRRFFAENPIDEVYLAAAKVGGIYANDTYPAGFIYQNLMVESNVIDAAHQNGVQHLLFLGSSCIYPKDAEQPMREDALLTGMLEPTNEPYAIAKIAGIKLCESYNRQFGRDYRSVMPTNLYGPGDNFHLENSHVVPALIRRIHEAKRAADPVVDIWGTGRQLREFLHVDDMASACLHVMRMGRDPLAKLTLPQRSHINVGNGKEYSIEDLANLIRAEVGYGGDLRFDVSKPDGAPRKLMNSELLISTGWTPRIGLIDGIQSVYKWYVEQ
ncbi:GDP-L-fucose synthase family protein [Luminiphilus sp. nBUS_07]